MVDQARESREASLPDYYIPNVRSTAAARARAGENYRPPAPIPAAPVVKAAPAPVASAPVVAAVPVEKPVIPIAVEVDPIPPVAQPAESFVTSALRTVRERAVALLRLFSGIPQIAE